MDAMFEAMASEPKQVEVRGKKNSATTLTNPWQE